MCIITNFKYNFKTNYNFVRDWNLDGRLEMLHDPKAWTYMTDVTETYPVIFRIDIQGTGNVLLFKIKTLLKNKLWQWVSDKENKKESNNV